MDTKRLDVFNYGNHTLVDVVYSTSWIPGLVDVVYHGYQMVGRFFYHRYQRLVDVVYCTSWILKLIDVVYHGYQRLVDSQQHQLDTKVSMYIKSTMNLKVSRCSLPRQLDTKVVDEVCYG